VRHAGEDVFISIARAAPCEHHKSYNWMLYAFDVFPASAPERGHNTRSVFIFLYMGKSPQAESNGRTTRNYLDDIILISIEPAVFEY
jgi:hypothetical protein